jgi:hypothetical protein
MTIRRWSGTFSRCQGPLRTPSWHTLRQKGRSIRYSGERHSQTGLQFAITKHWKFCVCEQWVLWYWSCISVCLQGACSSCFLFYLRQQDQCNYGDVSYIWQYGFFYPVIFILPSHITVAGNRHRIVRLVALSANRHRIVRMVALSAHRHRIVRSVALSTNRHIVRLVALSANRHRIVRLVALSANRHHIVRLLALSANRHRIVRLVALSANRHCIVRLVALSTNIHRIVRLVALSANRLVGNNIVLYIV